MARKKPNDRSIRLILFAVWILSGPAYAQNIPSPEEILGFKVGADYHLATYEQALLYFRALDKASPMMDVFTMGKTSMGKEMICALVSSEENMRHLDRYKEISKKLALAEEITAEEARRLSEEGKAIVWIDGGLHADEVAGAQQMLQLAYDVLASNDPDTRRIRENVILILVFTNPDGMQLVADWYHSNIGSPYEVSPMPWLFTKYTGNCNNRDSYMNNMVETQNITRVLNKEWFPQILLNHHQRAPFPARIWIPPNSEPHNPNVHPLVIRGKNLLGAAMGEDLDRKGQSGAISRILYDSWYPGYVTEVVDAHNIISLLTETALYHYATPHFYTPQDFPEEFRDFTPSVFYPNPWKGGWWRLRDAVEYVLTTSKAVLYMASVHREKFLYDRYLMAKEVISRFQKEPPYAWIIPREQWDLPTAAVLLNKMMEQGLDVYEAKKPFVSDGIAYGTGTWIIPMNQAFGLFAKALFEEQVYPDLSKYPSLWQGLVNPQNFPDAYLPPYDLAGWTLPYQMGVKIFAANSPLAAELSRLEKVIAPGGKVEGEGGFYLLSSKNNNSIIAANRILKKGGKALWARESFSSGGKTYPPGTVIVPAGSISRSFMETLARELFLPVGGASHVSSSTFQLSSPRVALYRPWIGRNSNDEGWTRWLLEQYEFSFVSLYDEEVKAGDLHSKYDVIVLPSLTADEMANGHRPGIVPPKYLGGMSERGVRNIKQFVENGGTLVALNQGCEFAIEQLGLPVKDVLKEIMAAGRSYGVVTAAQQAKFACPGSVLRMQFDPQHPVAYGMPEEAPAMFISSPAFVPLSSSDEKTPSTIAKYPSGKLLLSGYLEGEQYLHGKNSALDVPLGKGKVILLGFGVQQRAQPHGTFKLLFNSLFYSLVK